MAAVTVFGLSYLGVLEGPRLVDNTLALLEPTRGERIRRVGRDCAITITGYISGNLLISAICGRADQRWTQDLRRAVLRSDRPVRRAWPT